MFYITLTSPFDRPLVVNMERVQYMGTYRGVGGLKNAKTALEFESSSEQDSGYLLVQETISEIEAMLPAGLIDPHLD